MRHLFAGRSFLSLPLRKFGLLCGCMPLALGELDWIAVPLVVVAGGLAGDRPATARRDFQAGSCGQLRKRALRAGLQQARDNRIEHRKIETCLQLVK
jgi:hypothetical protein